jgi:hypothetical protein
VVEVSKKSIYRLSASAALEVFGEDGGLLLLLDELCLVEMNPTACRILEKTDGQHTLDQIASELADTFQISKDEALEDAVALYGSLLLHGIVEPVGTIQGQGGEFWHGKRSAVYSKS